MENEELKSKLIQKLERELTDFKDSLKELPAEQIIDNSYKITCMQTIQDYLANDKDYSKFELKTLLKREHILEECYIQRKKYQEVAEELNISVSAVRKHIVKALQVIREECAKKS